jgi:lysophospholipase L1-like esterase
VSNSDDSERFPVTPRPERAKRPLTWRGRVALLLLGPLVFFSLLEAGLRIGGFEYDPGKTVEGETHGELERPALYVADPELIWTLKPSTVLHQPPAFQQVRTNSRGLRGTELPGPRLPGEVRVLCLGDSVSFGLGLPDGKTWPEWMAKRLQSAPELAGRTVRVLNGAVPGYSSVQGLRILDELSDFEPDVVIFWFGINDAKPMRTLPDTQTRVATEGLSGRLAVLWNLRSFQLVQRLVTCAKVAGAEGTRVSRAEFRRNVERMQDLERGGGPQVIFVREPECIDVTLHELGSVVRRAEQEGAELIYAPQSLLDWISPDPVGSDLIGQRATYRDRPAILFQPDRADTLRELADVRADYELLLSRKKAFDEILVGLPADSLTAEDLFGDPPPGRVFADNCHVTPLGARLAGEALAREVIRRLGLR